MRLQQYLNEEKLPEPSKGFYRFTNNKKSPLSGVDYAMFNEDINKIRQYGKYGWEVDASKYPDEKKIKPPY